MEEKKKIGILNRGKNNKFINNTFSGLNVGIQDEGEKTFASGNEFLNTQEVEKSSHGVRTDTKKEKTGIVLWLLRNLWKIIIGVIIGLIVIFLASRLGL